MRRKTRRQIRLAAGLVMALALVVGGARLAQRSHEQLESAVITRPAPELTPTAQVLLPNLRGAVVVVPDRPHAPEEVQAPDRAERIRRTRSFEVNTSSLGLRGPEIQIPAPGPRVLAVGDSVTFGWGVSEQESWPAQLSGALGVEVVNAGVPAQRPDALTAWTLENAPKLGVDLVLYCRRPDGREPDPPAQLAAAVRRLKDGLGGTPVALILPPVSTFDPYGVSQDPSDLAALQAALPDVPVLDLTGAFRAALPRSGVVLSIDGGTQRVFREPGHAEILSAPAPATGLAPEITALFESDSTIKEPLFFDGGHPDAEGFALFASTVADFLRSQGLVPGDRVAPPPTTGEAPLIPGDAPEWRQEPAHFVDDPAFYGEASWDDVRGRVVQHQATVWRDRARLLAHSGDLSGVSATYLRAVAWLEAHPVRTGVGAAIYQIELAGLRRDLALTRALAQGQAPPVPEDGIARLRALMLGGASADRLSKELAGMSFAPLDREHFEDFQDRHALRVALVKAAVDAVDPMAFDETFGIWDPNSRAAIASDIVEAARGPTSLPLAKRAHLHFLVREVGPNLNRRPRFTVEGLGAMPTGDTWVDTGGEPGPAAIGRLEKLSLEDPEHRARLEEAAKRLQAALVADPKTVPAALQPLLDALAATPYTSRYYNIKAARNEAIRVLANAGAYAVAAQIIDQSFPLHAQDWACPNRAGILHGIQGRLLALAGDPRADDVMAEALRDGEAFWAQVDAAEGRGE